MDKSSETFIPAPLKWAAFGYFAYQSSDGQPWDPALYTRTLPLLLLIFLIANRLEKIFTRIYAHPLKDIPGPFLAKWTRLWEFSKEIKGDMTLEFHEKLVPQYGNVVRVGPNRVRIKDPEAFHIIHAARSPFLKDPYFYDAFGIEAMSVTTNVQKHHTKRRTLDPFFSKKYIIETHEALVQSKCSLMIDMIRKKSNELNGASLRVERALAGMMGEVASHVAFGISVGLLDEDKFMNHDLLIANEIQWASLPFLKLMPWINPYMMTLPHSILALLGPAASASAAIEIMVRREVDRIVASSAAGKELGDKPPSIDTLVQIIPGKTEKEKRELVADGMNQFIAGFHTTTWAASVGCYYLTKIPETQSRLRAELEGAMANFQISSGDGRSLLPFSVLEKLPYLTGVVKESLRLSYGIAGPLSRIVPPEGADLAGRHIPGGTAIELDGYGILSDPTIYRDPHKFAPERWDPDQTDAEELAFMTKHFIVFSRGNYNCIGQYLAVLDLYVCLANLAATFSLELDDELKKEGSFLWEERFVAVKKGVPILVKF